MSNSKNEILTRIRANKKNCKEFAQSEVLASVSGKSIYKPIGSDVVACFKNELESVNGECQVFASRADAFRWLAAFVMEQNSRCIFCRDITLADEVKQFAVPVSTDTADFSTLEVGLTGCEFLVARTGSILMSSALPSGRQMHAYSPVHIVLADEGQLLPYVEDALLALQQKYTPDLPSSITMVTGPSRTADIEKTLVLGAHGPKKLIVLLVRK